MGLWEVIHFSTQNGIDLVEIYGDCKVIIEWDMGRYKLQVFSINIDTKGLKFLLDPSIIYFSHISKIFNFEAD